MFEGPKLRRSPRARWLKFRTSAPAFDFGRRRWLAPPPMYPVAVVSGHGSPSTGSKSGYGHAWLHGRGGPEFTGGRRRRRRQQRRQRGLPEVPMLSPVQEQATAVPTARPEAEVEEDAKGSTSPPAPLRVSVLLGLCRCQADRLGVTRTM